MRRFSEERLFGQELRTNFGRQRKKKATRKGLPKVRWSSGTRKEPRINFKFFPPRRTKPTDLLSKTPPLTASRFAGSAGARSKPWKGAPVRKQGAAQKLRWARIGRLVLRVRPPPPLRPHGDAGSESGPARPGRASWVPRGEEPSPPLPPSSANPALDGRGAGTMRRVPLPGPPRSR